MSRSPAGGYAVQVVSDAPAFVTLPVLPHAEDGGRAAETFRLMALVRHEILSRNDRALRVEANLFGAEQIFEGQLVEAAAAGDDVVMIVEAVLLRPAFAGNGRQHVGPFRRGPHQVAHPAAILKLLRGHVPDHRPARLVGRNAQGAEGPQAIADLFDATGHWIVELVGMVDPRGPGTLLHIDHLRERRWASFDPAIAGPG